MPVQWRRGTADSSPPCPSPVTAQRYTAGDQARHFACSLSAEAGASQWEAAEAASWHTALGEVAGSVSLSTPCANDNQQVGVLCYSSLHSHLSGSTEAAPLSSKSPGQTPAQDTSTYKKHRPDSVAVLWLGPAQHLHCPAAATEGRSAVEGVRGSVRGKGDESVGEGRPAEREKNSWDDGGSVWGWREGQRLCAPHKANHQPAQCGACARALTHMQKTVAQYQYPGGSTQVAPPAAHNFDCDGMTTMRRGRRSWAHTRGHGSAHTMAGLLSAPDHRATGYCCNVTAAALLLQCYMPTIAATLQCHCYKIAM